MELIVSNNLINAKGIAVTMDAGKFIRCCLILDGLMAFSGLDGLQSLRLIMTNYQEYPAFLFELVLIKLRHVFIFCFYHDKVVFGALTNMQ